MLTLALLTAFLTTCALALPIEHNIIYVSQGWTGGGSAAGSPTTLEAAVSRPKAAKR